MKARRRGQYILSLTTEDGELLGRWKVHDGLYAEGDEDSTDLSRAHGLGVTSLIGEILDEVVKANAREAKK